MESCRLKADSPTTPVWNGGLEYDKSWSCILLNTFMALGAQGGLGLCTSLFDEIAYFGHDPKILAQQLARHCSLHRKLIQITHCTCGGFVSLDMVQVGGSEQRSRRKGDLAENNAQRHQLLGLSSTEEREETYLTWLRSCKKTGQSKVRIWLRLARFFFATPELGQWKLSTLLV